MSDKDKNKFDESLNLMLQRQMPNSIELERNVLGTIIRKNEYYGNVEDILSEDAFYAVPNKMIYRCVRHLLEEGKVADVNAVIATAKENRKTSVLTEFDIIECAAYNSPNTFLQDVDTIVDYGKRREAWKTFMLAANNVLTLTEDANDIINATKDKIDELSNISNINDGIVDAKEGIERIKKQVKENLDGVNNATIKTGFMFTDEKGGLRLGSILVIGAFTSYGKSSLAMNMAINVAKSGIPVVYYSMEMGTIELWSRVLSKTAGVNANKMMNFPLKIEERRSVDIACEKFANLPLYIDEKSTTKFSKMMRSVRMLVKKRGVKMFFVDYLQIFVQNGVKEKEESALSSMVRECKNLCRELGIVGIILSQLRRNGEEKHPSIEMLRGSGQIEESADSVMLIDRPEARPDWKVDKFLGKFSEVDIKGKAVLNVVKGRNTGLGAYLVGFDQEYTTFYELDGDTNKENTVMPTHDDNGLPSMINESDLPF